MENVDQNSVQQAEQNYLGHASTASIQNNFLGQLFGFDSQYSDTSAMLAAKYQNAFNSAEAVKNRNWQEYMSNTANQRAVKDLEKAGFSPLALLGNTSSASTPSGASASSSSGFGGASSKSGDIMKGLLSSVLLLGMSSANMMTKMNIANASNATKMKINSENLAKRFTTKDIFNSRGLLKGTVKSR